MEMIEKALVVERVAIAAEFAARRVEWLRHVERDITTLPKHVAAEVVALEAFIEAAKGVTS